VKQRRVSLCAKISTDPRLALFLAFCCKMVVKMIRLNQTFACGLVEIDGIHRNPRRHRRGKRGLAQVGCPGIVLARELVTNDDIYHGGKIR